MGPDEGATKERDERNHILPATEVIAQIGRDADRFFRGTEVMLIEPCKEGLAAVVMLAEFDVGGRDHLTFHRESSQFGKLVVSKIGKQPTSMMTTVGPVSRDIAHGFLGAISPQRIPMPQSSHARYKMASTTSLRDPENTKTIIKEVFSYVKRGDYVTVIEGKEYGAVDMYLCVTEARTIMHILTREGLVLKDDGLDHELDHEEGKLRFRPVDLPPGIKANALITIPSPYGANVLVGTNQGVRDLQGRVYCHTHSMNVTAMVAHPTENIIYFVADGKLFAMNHTDDGRISTLKAADLGPCDVGQFDSWKIFTGPQITHQNGPGVLLCGWNGTNYSSRVLPGSTAEALG